MNGKKILVVDDEPNIRSLIKRMLEKDYVIYQAENGQKAIDASLLYRPDLIIMDIMMPEVDGYTACAAIKSNPITGGIPIIFLTGVDYQANKELAKRLGADGYLTKPFNHGDLLKIIGPLLAAA